MVKIARIQADPTCCHWIVPDEKMSPDDLNFDGTSRLLDWKPPEFHVHNPKKARTDFYTGLTGAISMTSEMRFHPILMAYFEKAGELLPIKLETGEDLFILNVTSIADALDLEQAVMRKNPSTGVPVAIQQYAFNVERLPNSSIFKIPETKKVNILAYSGRAKSPVDEFLSVFLELKIAGLKVEEIWCA
ncbi:hypothetical protein BH09VER1_BH09VER1_23970 [soil metagenome]